MAVESSAKNSCVTYFSFDIPFLPQDQAETFILPPFSSPRKTIDDLKSSIEYNDLPVEEELLPDYDESDPSTEKSPKNNNNLELSNQKSTSSLGSLMKMDSSNNLDLSRGLSVKSGDQDIMDEMDALLND